MLFQISIPMTGASSGSLRFESGKPIFVAGANGAGKSALLQHLFREFSARGIHSEYLPGHRQISFNQNHDTLSQSFDDLHRNLIRNQEIFNRHRNQWNEELFKATIRRLLSLEGAFNARMLDRVRADPTNNAEIKLVAQEKSPLQLLNIIFASSYLPVRIAQRDAGVRALRNESEYPIEHMSDGERAALLLVGNALVIPRDSILLADEPEKHLHPSISAPLVRALIRLRRDICFVFATHDVRLLNSVESGTLVHLRSAELISAYPERHTFTASQSELGSGLSEGVKADLLGAKDSVLFTEGEQTSIDTDLYNILFPEFRIVPKGSGKAVIASVEGVTLNQEFSWLKARGVVDGDGRDSTERTLLAAKGVAVLSCATVENLFLNKSVLKELAQLKYDMSGGEPPEARIVNCQAELTNGLTQHRDSLAARLACWRINRKLGTLAVGVKDVFEGNTQLDVPDAATFFNSAKAEIDGILLSADPLTALMSVPLKNSDLPDRLSRAVGFSGGFSELRSTVLTQIQKGTDFGARIREAIQTYIEIPT